MVTIEEIKSALIKATTEMATVVLSSDKKEYRNFNIYIDPNDNRVWTSVFGSFMASLDYNHIDIDDADDPCPTIAFSNGTRGRIAIYADDYDKIECRGPKQEDE